MRVGPVPSCSSPESISTGVLISPCRFDEDVAEALTATVLAVRMCSIKARTLRATIEL